MRISFSVGAITASAGATTGVGAGGNQFFDDFTGSVLNSTDWIALNRDGDQSNSELQWYLPANVSVANSLLSITTKVQSSNGRAYTSGMVQWNSFSFTYGTVQVRAKMGGGTGPWPAIWLLGANCEATNPTTADNVGTCNWPQSGSDEIDIAEFQNSTYTSVWENVYTTGLQSSGNSGVLGFDASQGFHLYELAWSPGSLVWKVDGVTKRTVSNSLVPSTPKFLLLNCAAGGVGGGSVNDSTLPVTMDIDYVKVI